MPARYDTPQLPLKLETTIFVHRMNHKHDVKEHFH